MSAPMPIVIAVNTQFQGSAALAQAAQGLNTLGQRGKDLTDILLMGSDASIKMAAAQSRMEATGIQYANQLKTILDLETKRISGIQLSTAEMARLESATQAALRTQSAYLTQGARINEMERQRAMSPVPLGPPAPVTTPTPQEDPRKAPARGGGGGGDGGYGIGSQIKQAFVYGAVYGGYQTVSSSVQRNVAYSQQLGTTAANTGLSPSQMSALDAYIQQQAGSGTQPYDKSTLLAGAYGVASLGIGGGDVQQIAKVNTIIATLSAAGGATDTKQASDTITTLIADYGMTTNKNVVGFTQQVADQLQVAVKLGKAEFANFASQVASPAAQAAQLGVKSSDVLGYLAAESSGGVSSGELGQDLFSLLQSTVKPQPKQQAIANKLGFNLNSSTISSMGGIGPFIQMLQQRTASLSPQQRETVFSGLFNNEAAAKGLNAVIAQGGGGAFFSGVANSAGASDAAFKTSQSYIGNQLTDATVKLQTSFDALTTTAIPALVLAMGGVTSAFGALNSVLAGPGGKGGPGESLAGAMQVIGNFFNPASKDFGNLDASRRDAARQRDAFHTKQDASTQGINAPIMINGMPVVAAAPGSALWQKYGGRPYSLQQMAQYGDSAQQAAAQAALHPLPPPGPLGNTNTFYSPNSSLVLGPGGIPLPQHVFSAQSVAQAAQQAQFAAGLPAAQARWSAAGMAHASRDDIAMAPGGLSPAQQSQYAAGAAGALEIAGTGGKAGMKIDITTAMDALNLALKGNATESQIMTLKHNVFTAIAQGPGNQTQKALAAQQVEDQVTAALTAREQKKLGDALKKQSEVLDTLRGQFTIDQLKGVSTAGDASKIGAFETSLLKTNPALAAAMGIDSTSIQIEQLQLATKKSASGVTPGMARTRQDLQNAVTLAKTPAQRAAAQAALLKFDTANATAYGYDKSDLAVEAAGFKSSAAGPVAPGPIDIRPTGPGLGDALAGYESGTARLARGSQGGSALAEQLRELKQENDHLRQMLGEAQRTNVKLEDLKQLQRDQTRAIKASTGDSPAHGGTPKPPARVFATR